MNKERLKKLSDRAAQAVKVGEELEALSEVDDVSKLSTLEYILRSKVVKGGLDVMIREKERELESLLSTEPEPVTLSLEVVQPKNEPPEGGNLCDG